MALFWIKNTDGLKGGIQLINQIGKNKFQKLLKHISDHIGEKNDSGLFSSAELTELQPILNMNESEVALVIKTIRRILKRLCRFLMRPACVLEDLTNTLGIEQEKSLMFVEKYKIFIKNFTGEFDVTNLGTIHELKDAHWQANLEMTSSKNQLERCPTILFELQTSKPEFEKIIMEFDEGELKIFRQQLENIQNEVDNVLTQESA